MGSQLFRTKGIDQLISDADAPERRLKRTLGAGSLTALGIGAVIGSGIFTVIGTAIAGQQLTVSSIVNAPLLEYLIHRSPTFGRPGAGPAIALSFLLVAIVCGFAALCYAELASMIPIAGSAYTYTYATLGELVAWIIGWDLILEYAVSNMAVSVGFAAHIVDFLDWFGIHPSLQWITPAYLPAGMADAPASDAAFQPGFAFWPPEIGSMLHPDPSAATSFSHGRPRVMKSLGRDPSQDEFDGDDPVPPALHGHSSRSCALPSPTVFAEFAARQLVGSGSAQIRWSIAPNRRRVR